MSKRDTMADERASEHARYLATVLAERVADEDADLTSTDVETAAHLLLMGSYRQTTKLLPMDDGDVDLLVTLDKDVGELTDELRRQIRNLYAHADLIDNAPRASVRVHFHSDEQVDVMPVDRCSHAKIVEASHSDRFRQLVRLAKRLLPSGTPATGSCPAEQGEPNIRPRQFEVEVWLLLLAVHTLEGERLDQRCPQSAWIVEPRARCAAQSEPVALEVPPLTDDELTRAWRVARERYQQTVDKVRLLESSSLGGARSRASRRRTSPRAVQEVLKRAGVGINTSEPKDTA